MMKKYRIIIFSFLLSLGFNIFLHHFDNKYTYNDYDALCGVVDYSSSSQELHFLTSQWEFYNHQLLTPEMIGDGQGVMTRYIDIGQFGGFELGNQDESPHGQATYRLRIYDKPQQVMTMQLPEIYSAYSLYVNGELLYKSGEVEKQNYQPFILSTDITFTTQECNEMIIQVSDYDHYYSGMIYPIAYGNNQSIHIYETIQTLIKGLQSFLPLIMGLICLISYLFVGRKARDGYFSLVCMSYLMYILYAIIHLLIKDKTLLWYRIEDVGYYLLIYFITLLIAYQYDYHIHRKQIICGLFIIVISLIVPTFFILNHVFVIYLLSYIGLFYKCLLSFIMIYIIMKNLYNQGGLFLNLLTCFSVFFIVSLHMDNKFWYEPIYLGWGTEIAGFCVITYFSVIMIHEKIELYKGYQFIQKSKEDIQDYIYDVAHDLKAPASALNGYIELLNSGIAKKQNKEDYLLKQMEKKIHILSKRVSLLQTLDLEKDFVLEKEYLSILSLINELKEKYDVHLIKKDLTLDVFGKDFYISVDKEKLNICLENILMNAIEYSDPHTTLVIETKENETCYEIIITNQGQTIPKKDLSLIWERGYTSKEGDHSGLGLSICQKIMKAHMGEIEVISDNHQTSFILKMIKK